MPSFDGGDDFVGVLGPGKGLWLRIGVVEEAVVASLSSWRERNTPRLDSNPCFRRERANSLGSFAVCSCCVRRSRLGSRLFQIIPSMLLKKLRSAKSKLLARHSVAQNSHCHRFGEKSREAKSGPVTVQERSCSRRWLSSLSSGWVSSQSVRAVTNGSVPVFCHHNPSSPQRWTSR